MTTYICSQCHRAYYGHIRTEKVRPFLYCPGCGCHHARRATQMEARIVRYLKRNTLAV